MKLTHEKIVNEYIEELSSELINVKQWWNELIENVPGDDSPSEKEIKVRFRWPAGPASHPRIIAIFRKYYFLVENLNNELMEMEDQSDIGSEEVGWGEESDFAQEQGYIPPQALLLTQLETRAPELFEVMEYFAYIPIGLDPDEELEC